MFFRSSKLQKHLRMAEVWMDSTTSSKPNLFQYPHHIFLHTSIWEDIPIREWGKKFLTLQTELDFLEACVQHPVVDVSLLQKRQRCLCFSPSPPLLTEEIEDLLYWFQSSPTMSKNYLYQVLFPSSYYLRWVKKHPQMLQLYHLYRCYLNPLHSAIYPISAFIAPYWFLTKKWKFPISFPQYLQTIRNLFIIIKNQSNTLYWYRFVAIMLAYIAVYLYTTLQQIDISVQLHRFRRALVDKIERLHRLQESLQKIERNHPEFWKPFEPDIQKEDIFFSFQPNLQALYSILQSPSLQDNVKKIQKVCAIYNTLTKLERYIHLHGYQKVSYGDTTYYGDMKNPMLPSTQVANPICLQKNLIISGPNAGGKTTYVKSLLWNILLSQSFGILYGSYGQIKPFDAILHHHRIKDITGEASLFQAEAKKIREAMDCLPFYKNMIYFMDEPLHSTHPVDGMAMLRSFLTFFGECPTIRMVITSHFFSIQDLEGYHNLSVIAEVRPTDIYFDYRIYRGGSKQTVGIELLAKEDFPQRILKRAMEWKNILYSSKVNV